MIKELEELGLSPKEARVYLASLELGKATADQISKKAKINRSTTYVQLASLEEKGLMSEYVAKKKTIFVPESPDSLKRLYEKEKKELELKLEGFNKILPDLKNLISHAGEKPMVRFFQGKEGIVAIREEALEVKTKEMFIVYSFEKFREIFSQKERQEYTRRRIEKGIQSKIIYIHDVADIKRHALSEVHVFRSFELSLDADILIYDNNVALIVLGPTVHAIVIESSAISSTFRSLFQLLWRMSKEGNEYK